MFQIIFGAFYYLMVVEVIIFMFLNLPFPKEWKSFIFKTVAENPHFKTFLKAQLLLCIIAGLFYYDMSNHQIEFVKHKNKLREKSSLGAQMKKSTLSYQILQVQRNKYINFLIIFTYIVTVVFFWIKQKRYQKESFYNVEMAALQKEHPQLGISD